MHSVKAAILILLLVVPNTTWHDWIASRNPALQSIVQTGAVAEMMPRTAERDAITPAAELNTLLAGARMTADPDPSPLGYPVLPMNVVNALQARHWRIDIPSAASIPTQSDSPSSPRFIIDSVDAPLNLPAASRKISILKDAVQRSAPGSALIVVSDAPSRQEYAAHERLCPIVLWQPGMTAGLLTSPSTRTLGLVANTDIAPTIGKLAGIDTLPGPVYGAAAEIMPASTTSAIARLDYLAGTARTQEIQQSDIPYFAGCFAAVLAALGLLPSALASPVFRNTLVGIALGAPIALITAPTIWRVVIVGVFIASVWRLRLSGQPVKNVAAICAFCVLLIAADALFHHCRLIARSVMGYSYQEGARYYGLGNEAMGAMVGSLAVWTAYADTHVRNGRVAGIALWIAAAAIFAVPSIGAKAGGVLVAGVSLAGYLFAAVPGAGKPRSKRLLVSLCFAGLIGAAALLVATAHIGGDSHVALAIRQTRQFGGAVVASLFERKLGMDARLTLHSAWMLVLVVSLGIQMAARRRVARAGGETEEVLLFWRTGLVATAACLLLNDAGVVAAALCSLFPLAAISASSEAGRFAGRQMLGAGIS